MTMLITKFHKLIQSKILWLGILVFVVLAFVVWSTQVPEQNQQSIEAASPGKLYGEFVKPNRFQESYLNTYIGYSMMVGGPLRINDAVEKEMRGDAWRRLITLDKARELGIKASEKEIAGAIMQQPSFNVNGQFNPQAYGNFAQNVLRRIGINQLQFEAFIREQIIINKMRGMVSNSVLIPPDELNRTLSAVSDQFKVEYITLGESIMDDEEIDLTEEDIQAYFEEHAADFTIPEKVQVGYVQFPVSDYLAEVAGSITTEQALAYYEDNIDRFILLEEVDTNKFDIANLNTNAVETNQEVAVASASTNAFDDLLADLDAPATRTTTQAFEAVQATIIEELRRNAARQVALNHASGLIALLLPDRNKEAPPFTVVAASNDLNITQTEPFSYEEAVAGIDTNSGFKTAAFNLRPTPNESFSDAILGSNAVYVLHLLERFEPRVPAYEEVRLAAKEAAEIDAYAKAYSDKATRMRDEIQESLNKGKSFGEGVEVYGLIPFSTAEFTGATGIEDDIYADLILSGIFSRNEGELTELLAGENVFLLGYIAQRKAAPALTQETFRPQIIERSKEERGQRLFRAFQDDLLKQASFVDLRAPNDDDENEEESEQAGDMEG